MKPAQLFGIGITFSLCIACAYICQEAANKDAFFLREFGVSAADVQDLQVTNGGGFMSSWSVRRFKCEKPIKLRYATDFHAPYYRKWKDDPDYLKAFVDAFPADKDALSEKDQIEVLEVSYKDSSGEIKKSLVTNKGRRLYWYLVGNSS